MQGSLGLGLLVLLCVLWGRVEASNPALIGFEYSAGFGYVILNFDQDILASSLDPRGLEFRGNGDGSDNSVNNVYTISSIYNDLSVQGNTSAPYIFLDAEDYAKIIYYDYTFGQSVNDTYITMRNGTFQTFDGINCTEIVTPVKASAWLADTFPPYITQFSYNADNGQLDLSFNEPLHKLGENTSDNSIVQLAGIALQSEENIQIVNMDESNYVRLQDSSEEDSVSVLRTDDFGRNVVIYIGYSNMNLIKVGSTVARSASTTWLSLYSNVVANDTAGNNLALSNMDQFGAMAVTSFVPDTTSPTLLWWSFDVYYGRFVLRFSEVVDVMTFNYSSCYFVANNTAANTTKFRVDGPDDLVSLQTTDSNDIVLTLQEARYGELLDLAFMLTNESNSYLVLEAGAPWDTSLNQNRYADSTTSFDNARKVLKYYPDLVPPNLISAVLDMSNQTLLLGFDKFVAGSSVNVSYLFFQDVTAAGVDTEQFSFSPSFIELQDATVSDSKLVTLQLTPRGFNYLKGGAGFSNLALSSANTYLGVFSLFIHDKAKNKNKVTAVGSSSAFALTGYVPDSVAPVLMSWHADMNTGRLHLVFSEPLRKDTLDFTAITLHSASDMSGSTTYSHSLENATYSAYDASTDSIVATAADEDTLVTAQIDTIELNEIKDLYPLCQTRINCYISISSSFGQDTATYNETSGVYLSNPNEATDVMQSSTNHVVDSTGPKVTYYSLDMSAGKLYLTFDEPVYAGYFDSSGISLFKDSTDQTTNNVTLSTSSFVEEYITSTYLEVTFSRADFIRIKRAGIAENDTLDASIGVDSSTLEDLAGNGLDGTTEGGYPHPTSIVRDATAPSLLAIYSGPSTQNLTLYFDDVIDVSEIDLTYVYLYSPTNDDEYTIMNADVVTATDDGRIEIFLDSEVHYVLVEDGIAQQQSETQLYTTQTGSFIDVPRGLGSPVISKSAPVMEGLQLLYWRLDLTNRIVYVTCSFLPDITTTDLTLFSMYSTQPVSGDSEAEVSFTTSDIIEVINGDTIKITLDVTTFSTISASLPLADKSLLFLKASANAVVDANGKSLGKSSYTLACRQIIIDTNPPNVHSFTLDLDAGQVVVYFDKPITLSTVQLGAMWLYASRDSTANKVSMSTATLVTTATGVTSIELDLTQGSYPTLRDEIHLTGDVGSGTSYTYLVLSSGFAGDTNEPRNYLAAIEASSGLVASSVSQDGTLPVLQSWTMDMDAFAITVTFDEAVDATSNLASYYLLLEDSTDSASAQRYLTSSSTASTVGNTITINVDPIDMNAIKVQSPNLCTTSSNCRLSVKANAITDISHNSNRFSGVLFIYGTQPSTYVADTTPPQLQQWNFSAETGELWLNFDEVVDCESADLSALIMQYATFLGTSSQYVNLVSSSPTCSFSTGALSKELYVLLATSDYFAIKAKSSLFKGLDSCFIGGGLNAFTDTFGNKMEVISSGYQAINYTADATRPNLINFVVSSSKILFMYFDEPVNTDALDQTKVQMQDSPLPYTSAYNLSNLAGATVLYDADSYKMTVQLALQTDYSTISGDSNIFSLQEYTFLSILPSLVADTAGNMVNLINEADAIGMGPSIVSWNLNLNNSLLEFSFSEEMYPQFSPAGLQFQRMVSRASDDTYVTLVTRTNVTMADSTGTNFQVYLDEEDINNLKYYDIGFLLKHSYLVVEFGLTYSEVAATLIGNLKSTAIFPYRAMRANSLSADYVNIAITSFATDLNVGSLRIRCSEPPLMSSFDVSGVSLLSSSEGSSVALTEAVNVTSENVTHIVLYFSETDFNNVKLAEATGHLDSMVVSAGSVADKSGNAFPGNNELNLIREINSTADTTPPLLLDAVLNLIDGKIELTFDEVVEDSKLRPDYFAVVSDLNGDSSTTRIPLTNSTLVSMDDGGIVTLDLSSYQTDLTALNSDSSVGTTISNTYIEYNLVQDVFGNTVTTVEYLQVSSIVPDSNPVKVLAFLFYDTQAPSSYNVKIFYNKAVVTSTFICSEYSLMVANDSSSDSVSLIDDHCTMNTADEHATSIDFDITGNSASNINGLSYVAWMKVDNEDNGAGLEDIAGNTLGSNDYNIMEGARVTRWMLDIENSELTLIFSSSMKADAPLNTSALGFYSPQSYGTMWMDTNHTTLEPVFTGQSMGSATSVKYIMRKNVLDSLKALDVEDGVYLLVRERLLQTDDLSGYLNTVEATERFLPHILDGDTTRPQLKNATFDLGLGVLKLTYDEPIRSTNVVQTNFRMQSTGTGISNSLALSGAGATPTTDGSVLTLKLSNDDQASLMLAIGLADNESTTFMSYSSNSVFDYAGNAAKAYSSTAAYPVDIFVPDTTQPSLTLFDLNMDTGVLSVVFSEPAQATSINMTAILLMERQVSTEGSQYRLTGGTILDGDGNIIRVQLTDTDIVELKNSYGLVRDLASTYVRVDATFCVDTSGNPIREIPDGAAIGVSTFTGDTTSPSIQFVTLDMENNVLTLNISELIITGQVYLPSLTIQDSADSSTASHTLTTASSVVDNGNLFNDHVIIRLGAADANMLKYNYPLASEKNYSYISVTSAFLMDVYYNPLAPISESAAEKVNSFSTDVSPPAVAEYQIDLSTSQIILTFDEAIKYDSVDVSQVVIQEFVKRAQGHHILLSNCTTLSDSGVQSVYLYITLDADTAAFMKFYGIASNNVSSWLSFSDTFVSDNMGTYAQPKWDGSIFGYTPLSPNSYTADIVAPGVSSWLLDRSNDFLVIKFNEPVTINNSSRIYISDRNTISESGAAYSRLSALFNDSARYESDYSRRHTFTLHSTTCGTSNATTQCKPANVASVWDSATFYLLIEAGAVEDYAPTPNSIASMMTSTTSVAESSPECGSCSSGFYVSTSCTDTEDRLCTECSTCADGYFEAEACAVAADTNCKECALCTYGKYISTACGATNDAVCSDCTSCSAMEYETVSCANGANTECVSCQNCNLDAAFEVICRAQGLYESWYKANCCFDADGVQVNCGELDLANMKISARDGRHHWVFDDDSVDMSVYGVGMDW